MKLNTKFVRPGILASLLVALSACKWADGDLVTQLPPALTTAPLVSPAPVSEVPAPKQEAVVEPEWAVMALESADIPFDRAPYSAGPGKEENIVISYGTGATEIVVGARFGAPGGADDACGDALVETYKLLQNEAPPRHVTVRLVAFGGEAGGLDDGAAIYADASPPETVLGMLNLSACGPGSVFSVWDVRGAAERSLIVDALLQAGDAEGLAVGFHAGAPVGARDHVGFQDQGIPAVGLSAVPIEQANVGGKGSTELAAQLIAGTVGVFDAFLEADAP